MKDEYVELLNKLFTSVEIQEISKQLLIRIQDSLMEFLMNAMNFDMSEEELRALLMSDDEMLAITRKTVLNAVHRCTYEKMIIVTLAEMQKELSRFSIHIVPLRVGNSDAKS